MEQIINNITVQDFKDYFKREFNYLNSWDKNTIYTKNIIVYFENNFYISLQDNNINNLPTSSPDYWIIDTTINYNDYINDNDIEKAFSQAKCFFNYKLFNINNVDKIKMSYLLLTAHFLVVDLNMSNGNGASSFMITSKSVGSVSASYGIPQKILNSPLYSYLTNTQFGLKYLMLIYNKLIGNVYCIRGRTTF